MPDDTKTPTTPEPKPTVSDLSAEDQEIVDAEIRNLVNSGAAPDARRARQMVEGVHRAGMTAEQLHDALTAEKEENQTRKRR